MRSALLVAGRELRADLRHPDGVATAMTLMGALVLVESITIGPLTAREIAPALYWISLFFACVVLTTRSFDRELADDALDAVLALPGGRDALYAGKLLALAAVLALVAVVGAVLQVALVDLQLALPGHAALAALLGVASLPAVVILDVALTLRLRARAALVPILAVPVLLPQLLAATNAVALASSGDAAGSLAWSGLLVAVGLIYTVTGLTIAGTAIE